MTLITTYIQLQPFSETINLTNDPCKQQLFMLQPEASTEMAQLITNAEAVETETNTTQQDDG